MDFDTYNFILYFRHVAFTVDTLYKLIIIVRKIVESIVNISYTKNTIFVFQCRSSYTHFPFSSLALHERRVYLP